MSVDLSEVDIDKLYIHIMDDGSRIEGQSTHSLYEALRRGLVPKWALAKARELVESLDSEPKSLSKSTSIGERGYENDPDWDNAVRLLEDGQ